MPAADMKNLRVTALGAGVSGRSIALLASRLGHRVFVSEGGQIPEETLEMFRSNDIRFESGGHTDRAFECDIMVASSGFPPMSDVIARGRELGVRIVGELDFAMPHLRGRVLGITGSNGKTTTASLTGYLLKSLGHRVAVAGNIGNPISDIAGAELDFIVAELSSFQLHWASSISLAGAVVTNLAPDHLDWHGSYENYVRAKASILSFVERGGFSVIQERDAAALGDAGRSCRLSWGVGSDSDGIRLDSEGRSCCMRGRRLFGFGDTTLIGSHNMENVAMSLACVDLLGCDADKSRGALVSYEAPPHRCSLVLTRNGVRYIDDSKGTNIAASVAALSSIEGSKIVILGGRGKGEDYARLAGPLREFARWAVLMGEASGEIADALSSAGYVSYTTAGGMEEAVGIASGMALPGEVVLLSPACTSWDMYKNYGERGDHFAEIVRGLDGGEPHDES
ncbi:MAG: UDP-N-acetylmuramoyl-L-alanine--D-glutamate ligase [Synergistaceae bacterium]|jgi:UDP-N-acetylmuramoylalanine--D-glutamate ligase|nr:UDP-N-acetylmuramoyl-L-alanine--D-glutamate ligase [Synergistaceae bacterium]